VPVGHVSQVKLKDSVVSALRFCKAKEIELAWIDALLDLSHAKTDTGCVTDEDSTDNKGTLPSVQKKGNKIFSQ